MKSGTLVICNPENRRASMFLAALDANEKQSAIVVSWLDVIRDRVDWNRVLANIGRLRIESAGENEEVERELIAAGANTVDEEFPFAERISSENALKLKTDHGVIRYPRQWYLGFQDVLKKLAEATAFASNVQWNHKIDNILVMFDKIKCQARLSAAGISIPRALPRVGSYEELIQSMNGLDLHRVFIKLSHGSSASGVIAFERSRSQQHAYSSAEIVYQNNSVKLYNSLKVRRYTNSLEIVSMIDYVAREGVHIEEWLPKASTEGRRFDLRVVVIAGKTRHVVVRTSRHPMTNLHLGNMRGDLVPILNRMGVENWHAAMETCERVMIQFPGSLYAGVDLLIRNDYRRHAVLEVNAFGDLLPNILHEDQSTYKAEIMAQPMRTCPFVGAERT